MRGGERNIGCSIVWTQIASQHSAQATRDVYSRIHSVDRMSVMHRVPERHPERIGRR